MLNLKTCSLTIVVLLRLSLMENDLNYFLIKVDLFIFINQLKPTNPKHYYYYELPLVYIVAVPSREEAGERSHLGIIREFNCRK